MITYIIAAILTSLIHFSFGHNIYHNWFYEYEDVVFANKVGESFIFGVLFPLYYSMSMFLFVLIALAYLFYKR